MGRLYFTLAILLSQAAVWGQGSFMQAVEGLHKNPASTVDDLVALVADPAYARQLNPKAKTGLKNLRLVYNQLINYSRTQQWVTAVQAGHILAVFARQGVDFTSTAKNSAATMLLTEFVYDYRYKYQNIGMLIFENILQQGYDPYFVPEKTQYSMFYFAVLQVSTTSFYLDKLIENTNLNQVSHHLGASPFIFLASNLNDNNIRALDHIILYDNDLNINERTEDGKTSAFDRAIAFKSVALAQTLISGNIDLLAVCQVCAAENYLHRMALYDSLEIFKIMPQGVIKKLINQPDVNGQTPVFWALKNGQARLAIAFAEAGADLTLKDAAGLSVMNVARLNAAANHAFLQHVEGNR